MPTLHIEVLKHLDPKFLKPNKDTTSHSTSQVISLYNNYRACSKKSINQYTNTSIPIKLYKKNILVILEHKLVYWSNKFNYIIT